jgi:hypothetical protein
MRGVDEADVNDVTKEICMRTEQATGKAAWGAVMVVALVAMAFSTTMFARQDDDPVDAQTVVLANGITEQGVQSAELGSSVSADGENEMSAENWAPDDSSLVENCGDVDPEQASVADNSTDTDTEEASAADNGTDMDSEEASAADNASDVDTEEASAADNGTDMDTEQASAADNSTDMDTEGVSPETGNP